MPFGYTLLTALTLLSMVAALAVTVRVRCEGRGEQVVVFSMIWNALVIIPIYGLGLTHRLHRGTLAFVSAVWFCAVLSATFRGVDRRAFSRALGEAAIGLSRLPRDAIRLAARRRSLVTIGLVLSLGTIVWTILMSWYVPNWGQWDALWYHEPMIGFAIQNHGFDMVELPMSLQKINGYPRLCEMTQLWFVVFTDRRLVEVTNSVMSPALIASVYVLCRRFGRDEVSSMGWGATLLLMPFVSNLLQTQYVDTHYATFVIAGTHFATRPKLRVRDALLASVCLSLAIGAKSMALVPVGILAVMTLVRLLAAHVKPRPWAVTATALAGTASICGMAATTYLRNWWHFHNPLWPDVKVDIDKWNIHWPGSVPMGFGNTGGSTAKIDMNLPLPEFLEDLYALPYTTKMGTVYYQTYDYGFGLGYVILPLAILALTAIVTSVVVSWTFRVTRWSPWRCAPETENALLVALPGLAILYTSPALWSARYNVAAVAGMMALIAWLAARKGFARLGVSAVSAALVAAIIMFVWTPRWIYFPSELAALARIPYPQREATPQSVISPKLHLARGSAITSDVGVAREREVGADALVLFDDAYGGFPALFWNNRYSNRVLYVPTEKLFDEAERQNATWVYVTWGDPNIYSLRAPESGWQQVGTFNVEGWGATFRRPPILRPR